MKEQPDDELLRECQTRELRFRAVLDHLDAAIIILDVTTLAIIYANKHACELYGYAREEILQLDFGDISSGNPPCTREHALELAQKTISGEPQSLDWCAKTRTGGTFEVEVKMRQIDPGEERYVLLVAHDVLERKMTAEALRESEERFKGLVEQSPLSIQILDRSGRTLQVNRAYENLWGITMDDLQDYNILEDEQLKQRDLMPYVERGFAGEVTSLPTVQYDAKDTVGKGYKPWVRAFIYPVKDDRGNVRNVILMHEDITEIMRAEEEKRTFYRQTILSATNGKLQICDEDETQPYLQNAQVVVSVRRASDVTDARREVASVLQGLGVELGDPSIFMIAVGEAVTNALKHAGQGCVYAGISPDEAWVAVEDSGPGIDSIILPGAVLRRGFSTRPSMGLGYSIMLDASDRILLKTGTDGTTVVLIKYLQEKPLMLEMLPDTWKNMIS